MSVAVFLKRVVSFASTNVLTQAIGAISGILLVRWMPINDYAIYSVVMTVAGAITILTKGGVHLGLSSILGRVWPDLDRAASLISATIEVRRLVSAIILPIIIISSYYLIRRAGANDVLSIALCFSLAAFWWADMRTRVVDQILFFSKDAHYVQGVDLRVAVARISLISIMNIFGVVSVLSAAIVNVFGAVARIRPISGRINKTLHGRVGIPRDDDLREIKKISYRQIPTDIFYVCQAQLAMGFLVSAANSTSIATYGALSRISQLLTPVEAVSLALFVPIFSSGSLGSIRKYVSLLALGAVPGLILSAVAIFAPRFLLWPLGPAYFNQVEALIACALTSAFNVTTNIAWSLAAHRGWNRWGWLRIPFGIFWCLSAPFFLPTNTVSGAFLFFSGFSIGVLLAVLFDLLHAAKRGELRWDSDITSNVRSGA